MRNGLAVDFPPLQSVADELIHLVDRYAEPERAVGHEGREKIPFAGQAQLEFPEEQRRHPLGGEAGRNNPVLQANACVNAHDHVHVRRREM